MDGLELNIDVSAFEQADKHLESIVHNAQNLKKTLSALLSGTDIAHVQQIMGQLSDSISAIEKTTVSPKFDVAKAEDMFDVMQKIVYAVQNLSSHGTIEFFDPKHLYESGRYVGDILDDIHSVEEALKTIDDKWKSGKGFVAPTHSDGREYRKQSDKYQKARAAYNMELEIERRQHQERLKMLQAELDAANMTAMEKVAFADKVANANARANDKVVKGMKSQYKDTLREMKQLLSSITALENKNTDNEFDSQIAEKEQRFQELNARRRNLEEQLGSELVDIAKRYNAEILDIEVRRIEQKKQKEEEAVRAYRSTYEGALDFADKATTINQMKEAQKYLQEARGNTDVKKDTDKIEELNSAYTRLRATIESLTTAEKNENSLQPTLRNEYARLIRELSKLREARNKAKETDAYNQKDKKTENEVDAIVKRIHDIESRAATIRANARGLLAEEDKKFAAEKAQRELAETERLEAQKNAIRQKYRTINASEANSVLQEASQSKNVTQAEKAIEDLKDAIKHLNTEDEKYEQTLESLNKEIEKHTHTIKMATDASYRDKDKYGTYEGALKYKEEARTLKDQIKAIEYLKIARQNLDRVSLGESEYKRKMEKLNKEIRRSQREVNKLQEDFKNFNSKAGDLIGQLSRRMALLFSVSAIEGYVQKIASIRGEFEIQQRSLQVLIGSQEEANKIWEQTVALAVKSPFRVKELVTYTKQLAAYRIETEKLHDTTKMLADVSSGLGVDMNRLILAYGQVKAANYLRGTELRQFSEAGVNLLKDLADYFTVVEGRAVSVAEVFDRVSKRMVTFEHVDTIIRNMTSEGGQFYKMQEKQSETLKGMLMNFQDSMDLMMNDIGKDYEDALKTSVSLAKSLVEQWRMMAPLITVASSVALVFMGRLVKAKLAAISLSATLKSISPMGWATMAAGLAYAIYQWVEATQQFKKELREVEREITKTLNEGLYMYRTLAEACNDATKSEKERHEAYVKLSTQFKEILPDQLLELEYVRSLADDYKEVEHAMQSYYNNKARQLKLDKIETKYGTDIQTDLDDLIVGVDDYLDNMTNVVDKTNGKIKILTRATKDEIGMVFGSISTQVVQDIKNGEMAVDDMLSEIKSRITKYFKGDDIALSAIEQMFWTWQGHVYATTDQFIRKNLGELENGLKEFRKQSDFVTGLPTETQAQKQAIALLEDETAAVEVLQQAYNKLTNLYVDRAKAPETGGGMTKNEYTNDINAILHELTTKYPQYKKLIEEFSNGMYNVKNNVWELLEFSQKFESEFVHRIADGFGLATQATSEYRDATGKEIEILITQTQKKLSKLANNKAWTEGFKVGMDGIKKLAEQYNISLSDFANYMPKVEQTSAELEKQYDALAATFKDRRQKLAASATEVPLFHAQAILSEKYTEQELQNLENFWSKVAKMYGNYEKDTSKGAGKDWFAEMGKAIRDTHKDFLTLHEDLNETRALELAMEKHSDVFAEAAKGAKMVGLSLSDFRSLLVEDNAIRALEDLLGRIPEKASKSRLAIEKMIGELKGGEEVRKAQERYEELNNNIEKLFGTYELSIELKDMNIPTDLAERLFNFESIDLSELRKKVLDDVAPFDIDKSDDYIIEKLKKQGVDENRIKIIEDTLQKIANKEREEQLARSKNYIKYLRQAESERVQIHAEAARKIKEIDAMTYGDAIDKQRMKEAVNAERDKKLQEQEWKAFKSSDMYLTLFTDLNSLGKQATARLIDNLSKLKKSLKELDPSDLKAITDEIKKLEEHQIKQDPFGAMLESFKEVYALRKKGYTFDSLQTDLVGSNQKLEEYRKQIDEYSFELQRLQGMTFEDKLSTKYVENEQKKQDLLSQIMSTKALVELEEQRNATIQDNIQSYRNMQKSVAASNEIISTFLGHAQSAYGSIKQILAVLGVEADSNAMIFADMGIDLVECIAKGVQLQLQIMSITVAAEAMGVAMNTALGIIGWINIALQAIASVFTAIFNVSDNEKKKQIEQLKLQVDDLSASFEKLETAMHNALTTNDLDTFTKASISNLEAQNSALEAQIAIESTRKHKNEQDMREWQKTIEENEEKMRELEEERIKELGGVGGADEIKGAAQDFVDAWLDAFLETGNGLVGLEEQFDEWAKNLVKKQLLNQVAGQIISPLATKMNALVEDGEVTDQEWADWDAAVAKELPIMNARMQKFVEDMGAINDLSTQSELGGLQEGIKSIQENTAQEIVAYMNSLRFLISDRNDSVANIGNMLTENFTTYVNPMLSQLEAMANETATISKLLSSIITNHPNGGNCVRVVD